MSAFNPPPCRARLAAVLVLALATLARRYGAAAPTTTAAAPVPSAPALTLSVYATASDVLRHLAPPTARAAVLARLRPLRVSRVFLEGRRGDEYVPPATLAEVRDFLAAQGLASAGGIATVPGDNFGMRQNEGLGWLNWEPEKTRRDVAHFFTENAAVFDTLIVDDFFCTGDTSPASAAARGARSWAAYRRDLLVSLIEPLMLGPARAQRPDVQLIIKFPQWYDRFHLFGYDPARMAGPFARVWVGTEVRNPHTRRMGYVPPTEGYVNFRWLHAVCGEKTTGAWFDHIECTAENFTDQAFQSVLAGARELTLFRLGDLMADHPGDALLAQRLPELFELAAKVRQRTPHGLAWYKPPNSDAEDNLYLADYLAQMGLPVWPVARWPADARVVCLGAQAAADPEATPRLQAHLAAGRTAAVTPAFLRRAGPTAQRLAGVKVGPAAEPTEASRVQVGARHHVLPRPLEVDGSLVAGTARVRLAGTVAGGTSVPLLTEQRTGRGRLLVLNLRTFDEGDLHAAGEWLLCPKPLGWSELPAPVAGAVREVLLAPLRVRLEAPAGVGLYLWDEAACLYNFHDVAVRVRFNGRALELPPHGPYWVERPGPARRPTAAASEGDFHGAGRPR